MSDTTIEEIRAAMQAHADSLASADEPPDLPPDNNCLSYWFPKLLAAGLPVPRTEIVRMPDRECWRALYEPFDGNPIGEAAKPFIAELRGAVERVGTPCFLRTGQTSGKHNWKRTCHLTDVSKLESHVVALIEFSEMCDFMGLAVDAWAVRELLPTKPLCVLPNYGDFPLVPEARCFINGGQVVCSHPYWPRRSVEEGFPYRTDRFDEHEQHILPANIEDIVAAACVGVDFEALSLAARVAEAFKDDGAWSVDILPTDRGFFVTDMALAARSFHWEGCPNEARFRNG